MTSTADLPSALSADAKSILQILDAASILHVLPDFEHHDDPDTLNPIRLALQRVMLCDGDIFRSINGLQLSSSANATPSNAYSAFPDLGILQWLNLPLTALVTATMTSQTTAFAGDVAIPLGLFGDPAIEECGMMFGLRKSVRRRYIIR